MSALPVEILLGIYLGLLVGIIPALVSWALGFGFRYVVGVTLPGFGVTVLAIALAGVNGGLLALTDKAILQSPAAPRVVTAILIVAMLSMYAHSKGDAMATTAPRRPSLADLGERTLSLDLADLVGGRDEVRIHVTGTVADMEGYPPLSEELRAEIRSAELTFPTDLRVPELEERVADRLRTEFDLGEVSVDIDERGRASVTAAPPFSGLSKRVADGRHAVSVDGRIPTGLARGDEVTLITTAAQVRGTVVSARTGDREPRPDIEHRSADEPAESESPLPVRAPTTEGGEGRLTVAVTRTDVQPLLRAERAKVVVESRGTRREYEVVSLLRRADKRFRRLTVGPDSPLAGTRFADLRLREDHAVDVLAIRRDRGWALAPDADTVLGREDAILAVGDRDALEQFQDVVA
jgi:hypothetical protein